MNKFKTIILVASKIRYAVAQRIPLISYIYMYVGSGITRLKPHYTGLAIAVHFDIPFRIVIAVVTSQVKKKKNKKKQIVRRSQRTSSTSRNMTYAGVTETTQRLRFVVCPTPPLVAKLGVSFWRGKQR